MGLFKKKKEVQPEISELPELPELPDFPETESSKSRLPEFKSRELPAFPGSKTGESFTQEAVKSAVSLPPLQGQKWQESKILPIRAPPPISAPVFSQPRAKAAEPIYIRLDKFKYAANSFDEIRSKIAEIESLLNRIREIKHREETELEEWEREIENVKARLNSIEQNIFSKIE